MAIPESSTAYLDRPLRCWVLVASVLAVHGLLLGWSASRQSPTGDEVASIAAGISHWQLGQFDLYRVNPPLVRVVATLPLFLAGYEIDFSSYGSSDFVRAEHVIGASFIEQHGLRSPLLFLVARLACIPFSMLGAWVCFHWAQDLYGWKAGLLALLLWCFSPNVIGHGQLCTTDIPGAALGVAAVYAFWIWCSRPTSKRAVVAGSVLGLALLTKSTWVILVILLPVFWSYLACLGQRRKSKAQTWVAGVQLTLLMTLAVGVLNLGYGFEGSFQRLDQYKFISSPLASTESRIAGGRGGNRFAGTWIGRLPVPAPRNFVQGLDVQKWELERENWSYLRGEWRREGWWYYYLYGLGVKEPVSTWVLVFMATVMFCRRSQSPGTGRAELLLVLIPMGVLLVASCQSNQNHHVRYVFPALPFIFVWASQSVRSPSPLQARFVGVAVVALMTGSLWTFPHNLSYFNALSGGPLVGHSHLLSSNIDWGQDLLLLRQWLSQHPEAASARIALHDGIVDPRDLGIVESLVPPGPFAGIRATQEELLNFGPQAGWYILNVGRLRDRSQRFSYFLLLEPKARVGYSIYVYHITLEEANRIRERLNLPEI